MKKFVLFLAFAFLCLAGDSEKQNTKVSFEQKIVSINNESIDNQVSYWRAHAYVNLKFMRFQINKILTTKN